MGRTRTVYAERGEHIRVVRPKSDGGCIGCITTIVAWIIVIWFISLFF